MDHRLDSLKYMFESGQIKIRSGTEDILNEFRSYQYKKRMNSDFIESECSVVEIDGKKLKCFFRGHQIKISIYPNGTWFGKCECGGNFHIEINVFGPTEEEIK